MNKIQLNKNVECLVINQKGKTERSGKNKRKNTNEDSWTMEVNGKNKIIKIYI